MLESVIIALGPERKKLKEIIISNYGVRDWIKGLSKLPRPCVYFSKNKTQHNPLLVMLSK